MPIVSQAVLEDFARRAELDIQDAETILRIAQHLFGGDIAESLALAGELPLIVSMERRERARGRCFST